MIGTVPTLALATLPWSGLLLGLWLALSAAQWWTATSLFSDDGPLALREVARLRDWRWVMALRRRLTVRQIRLGWAMQMLVALMLIGAGWLRLPPGMLVILLALILAWQATFLLLTGDYHADGSDKIALIVTAGTLLTAAGIVADDPALALAGMLLSGGQLILSYAVAGWCKLVLPGWRDGSALAAILGSRSWGHPGLARPLRHRGLARAIAWGVMGVEAAFPLTLLLPAPGLAAALGVMLAFHVATAVVMGLNRFPWAFASAFPAVLALGALLRGAL